MRAVVLPLLSAAACHASLSSSGIDSAPASGPPSFVQAVDSGPISGTSTTLHLAPTGQGDVIAIFLVHLASAQMSAARLTSGAGAVRPIYFLPSGCGSEIDLWLIDHAGAGFTTIDVEFPPSSFEVLALELSGLAGPAESSSPAYGAAPPAIAPTVQASPDDLVISEVAACGSNLALASNSRFTMFGAGSGMAVAYTIPAAAEFDGAAWLFDGTSWNAHTHRFR